MVSSTGSDAQEGEKVAYNGSSKRRNGIITEILCGNRDDAMRSGKSSGELPREGSAGETESYDHDVDEFGRHGAM